MHKTRVNNKIPLAMLAVSLLGFGLFYLFPFVFSLLYALTDSPLSLNFVGLDNFIGLLNNKYFLQGLTNTAKFMVISIPLNMVLSLIVALIVNNSGRWRRVYSLVFLIPLVIPSATTAFFWENFFSLYGPFNKWLGLSIDWFQSDYGLYVVIFIFLWKNIGYNMALFVSGLNNIPREYYESAEVEGAGGWQKFRNVTMVYLTPTTFLVLIMTVVNSFKVFKEIYIITGEYPHESLYVLQHYMNNMFLSLNYPKLASAIYILTIVIVLFIGCVFRLEGKVSKNLSW